MKKVKFSTDNGNDFFREFKQEVNDYFLSNKLDRRGGVKMKARIFLYFGLVLSSYFLITREISKLNYSLSERCFQVQCFR